MYKILFILATIMPVSHWIAVCLSFDVEGAVEFCDHRWINFLCQMDLTVYTLSCFELAWFDGVYFNVRQKELMLIIGK